MEAQPSICLGSETRVQRHKRSPNVVTLTLVLVWGLFVAVGSCALWRYAAGPGDGGEAPGSWPAKSQVARDGRFTLLFFAHPLCPCTRASLAELERLVAVCHDRVDTHVLFIAPVGTNSAWHDSDLHTMARRIPGVTMHTDTDRRETDIFRARTSGACLLYDPSGRLVFDGGLTAARGHEGNSVGSHSIKALSLGEDVKVRHTPVFGCPLFETQADCPGTECSSK